MNPSFLSQTAQLVLLSIGMMIPAGPQEEKNGTKPADLLNTSWNLASISDAKGEVALPEDHGITLAIDGEGRASGRSAVNRYFGSVTGGEGKVSWSPLGCTRMAGPPEKMMAESTYLQALGKTDAYTVKDGALVFSNEKEQLTLTFKAAGEAAP